MRRLSGLARTCGYKVVLTGEGADEALGGYDLFKEAKIRQFWARNPQSRWRPLLLKTLYPYLETSGTQAQTYLRSFYGIGLDDPNQRGFSHLTRWFTTAQCKVFFSPELSAAIREDAATPLLESLPMAFDRWHPFNRAQYLEAKTPAERLSVVFAGRPDADGEFRRRAFPILRSPRDRVRQSPASASENARAQ